MVLCESKIDDNNFFFPAKAATRLGVPKFGNVSRILRLEPASQPKNFRAEPDKLEQATARSIMMHYGTTHSLVYIYILDMGAFFVPKWMAYSVIATHHECKLC